MPIKRTYAEQGDACATAHGMEVVGDRWTYPILRELMLAPKRFGELRHGLLGITPAVLTARLRQMEQQGLLCRSTPPGGGVAYEITPWARELRPVFDGLALWAQRSPTWRPDGTGLTPDGAVQSMLAMAAGASLVPAVALELRLHDARVGGPSYRYRLTWSDVLDIERGEMQHADAVVTADSTTWVGVLYEGLPLDRVDVAGDAAAVRRVIDAYA